jgi:hypothetical protein
MPFFWRALTETLLFVATGPADFLLFPVFPAFPVLDVTFEPRLGTLGAFIARLFGDAALALF